MPHRKPSHLFKYVPAARIDILRNARICFTTPAAFNDPFDVLPGLLRTVFASEVDEFGLQSAEKLEDYLQQGFREDCKHTASIRNDIGVLSLAAEPTNLLMWSHYADHHRGFVLEFAATHPFFHQQLAKDDEFHHVRPVRYARDRPGILIDSFRAARVLLTKSIEWRYEREWRMLVDFTRFPHEVVRAGGQDIRLVPVPPDCITGVVLGARMPDEAKEQLWSVISQPCYEHVAVCSSEVHTTQYRVSFQRGQPHYKRANELVKQALRVRDPDTAADSAKTGDSAARVQLVEEAIAELNRALRYWRSCSAYWAARAGCQQILGRYEAALEDLTAALNVASPTEAPNLYLLRAHLFAQLERFAEMKPDLQRAANGKVDAELFKAVKHALTRQLAMVTREAASLPRRSRRRRQHETTQPRR